MRVSTHAPARGATVLSRFSVLRVRVSTHAPARGATFAALALKTHAKFQLTRPQGARLTTDTNLKGVIWFQLTRPQGARHVDETNNVAVLAVSTHAPARGATLGDGNPNDIAWFQLTRPQGARREKLHEGNRVAAGFNSRARKGRDKNPHETRKLQIVSTHAPARGATSSNAAPKMILQFQLTRPQGARPAHRLLALHFPWFQLTRPQGARHGTLEINFEGGLVSTHAPARGATRARRDGPHGRQVSTHAPARGATGGGGGSGSIRCFNSRARKGRDPGAAVGVGRSAVSTHAPARGATSDFRVRRKRVPGFNSRARKGRDGNVPGKACRGCVSTHAPARGATYETLCSALCYVFQLTRPQGARRLFVCISSTLFLFQLTRPQGARHALRRPGRHRAVSTHAPARGATRIPRRRTAMASSFNSRARKGRDLTASSSLAVSAKFQLTRPQGARHFKEFNDEVISSFNSRARKGRDDDAKRHAADVRVSTHAPARGATGVPLGHPVLRKLFQLTRPQGARRPPCPATSPISSFNSRARKGRDSIATSLPSLPSVSTHAPARGATTLTECVTVGFEFQLTRPQGARQGFLADEQLWRQVSTHAPARGATLTTHA